MDFAAKKNNSVVDFLKNFLTLFLFRSIGIIVCLVTNILNVRKLSVEDNGQFSMAISLGNLLVIPLVMGVNTSLLKIIPETPKEERESLIGTVFSGNMIICAVVTAIGLLVMPFASNVLNISQQSWMLALLFAIISNWCILIETILRVKESFKIIGIAKVISSLLLLASYLVLIYGFQIINFYIFLLLNIGGQAIIFLITFVKNGKIRFCLKKDIIQKIYKISLIYMVSWFLSTCLFKVDMYVLSHFENEYTVGIYSVYMDNIRNYFSIFYHDIFAAVFLPTILNRNITKEKLYKNLLRYLPLIFLVLIGGTALVVILFMAAYGSKYALIPSYIIFTSLGIAFQGLYFLFNSILVVDGMKGAVLSLKILAIPYVFFIGNIIALTYFFGINGTFISFVINQFVLMVLLLVRMRANQAKD